MPPKLTYWAWIAFGAFLLLWGIDLPAFAQAAPPAVQPDVSVMNAVTQALQEASGPLVPMATKWLASFMALQYVFTHYKMLLNGDELFSIMGKFALSLAWFGGCIWVLQNGGGFIETVGTGVMRLFNPNPVTTATIVTSIISLGMALIGAIAVIGTSIVGSGNTSLAMILVVFFFIVLGVGLYMVVKLMMLSLELNLIVMLAPLSFSFLGLNALRDQGIAPFKALLALVYRIILVGIITNAFTNVSSDTVAALANVKWSITGFGTAIHVLIAAVLSYPILAFLLFKSDAIASALASGTSSLGTADVSSTAMAAGALGGAAALAAPTTMKALGNAIGDALQKRFGKGELTAKNTSDIGTSGLNVPAPPAPKASRSRESQGGQTLPDQAPKRTPSPTTNTNAPALGSATDAGISGPTSPSTGHYSSDPRVDQAMEALAKMNEPRQGSVKDAVSNLMHQHGQEKHTVGVSINGHHSD